MYIKSIALFVAIYIHGALAATATGAPTLYLYSGSGTEQGQGSTLEVEGCPEEYDAGTVYGPGDKVSIIGVGEGEDVGKIYQCKKSWPEGTNWCVKEAYKPGRGAAYYNETPLWTQAWSYIGGCKSTISVGRTSSATMAIGLIDNSEVGSKGKENHSFPVDRRLSHTITASECSLDPTTVYNTPELFGLNWILNDGAKILTEEDAPEVGDHFEIPGYKLNGVTPYAMTSQSFHRPLEVSVEVRLMPGTNPELKCLSLDLFAPSSCYEANPNNLGMCGYKTGIGHKVYKFYANAFEINFYLSPFDVDMSIWNTLKIELPQDGSIHYYLNGVLYWSTAPSTTSLTEGTIGLNSCNGGQFRNLIVHCPSSQPSSQPSLTPSFVPSKSSQPSSEPSLTPSKSSEPSSEPSFVPSKSFQPSSEPSLTPSKSSEPSSEPSFVPSKSFQPSSEPSLTPSKSSEPSSEPSFVPSKSFQPSSEPSLTPSKSSEPSSEPSFVPSKSFQPSSEPSLSPSESSEPSSQPSLSPSESSEPSSQPSLVPSESAQPSLEPSRTPSGEPSSGPSEEQSSQPSLQPSPEPSSMPSCTPSSAPTPPETTHLFYPDWSPNGSGGCLNNGEQPHYMTINTADYMTSTLAACCAKFFNWDYDECTGNHPDECIPALFYPDWEGGSGSCVADGNEPAYMNTNSHVFLFNNKPDCCKMFYNWDYYNCVGTAANDANNNAASNSLYYPDWEDPAHICKSDGNQPLYMNLYPDIWMHTTLEKCCKQNYGWNYNKCMGGGVPAPSPVVNAKYYMVWGNIAKCVQDCDVGAGPNCGGRANFWDQLFDTRSSCCKNMNWWNTNCDK